MKRPELKQGIRNLELWFMPMKDDISRVEHIPHLALLLEHILRHGAFVLAAFLCFAFLLLFGVRCVICRRCCARLVF